MIAAKIRGKNREHKYQLFIKQLNPSENDLLLDVGFCNLEFSEVDNFLEKNYPYPHNITALGIENGDLFRERYPLVTTCIYDGNNFPFENNTFDIGWSNAVLEHVGDEERQIRYLKELCRTCKKVYFTTPNRFFPIELHTRLPLIHWLPKKAFDRLISFTPKSWAAGEYMFLLSYRQLKKQLKKAGIDHYRIFRNRFCGFTMDFSILITEHT